jgi:hypothetical protein
MASIHDLASNNKYLVATKHFNPFLFAYITDVSYVATECFYLRASTIDTDQA